MTQWVTKCTCFAYFFVQKIQGKLEPDGLHVRLLQGRGDVHVHVEEPLHGASLLGLLDLQLGQEVDEPLERTLVAVDPEEVDFAEIEDGSGRAVGPLVIAFRTRISDLPELVHDGLKDGGEGRDADSRPDQDGVLGPEDLTSWSSERTVDVDLEKAG